LLVAETAARNGKRFGGSSMSTKQLARTVQDGRMVTFIHQVGERTGYLCGMDDFHWMIVTPECRTHLIHKGSAPFIDPAPDATYRSEPNVDALERIVGPFRDYLEEANLIRRARAASA
jgi:hypothetical protein